jgi:hypothetical protein
MSDPRRRPPVSIRVEDIRVEHADVPPDEEPAAATPPASTTGSFRHSLGRVLDAWHVVPTEPWW